MKADFTRLLLVWNTSQNLREMPWKGEKDPYKIWLSEIILQQTRVEQGRIYYEKFLKTFPTIKQLAKAPDEKVFKLWEGLGYYSRCKNLLFTARKIVQEMDAIFPDTYEEIKKLKGIGPYTAAAIASFAFNEPYAVVDGNVQRVIARYFGIVSPPDTSAGKKIYDLLAQALLDKKKPAIYNQAIMDFGAVICKPQNPLCNQCIQKKDCMALKLNEVKSLPVKGKRIDKKNRWFYYFLFLCNNQVYVRKRIQKDIWQNLYEFVLEESSAPIIHSFEDCRFVEKIIGKHAYTISSISKMYRQQLSHQYINGQFIVITVKKELTSLSDYSLVGKDKIKKIPFPVLIQRYLQSNPQIVH